MKSKKLIIIGASGHGKVVCDSARRTGLYSEIVFMDDAVVGEFYGSYVIGKISEASRFISDYSFVVAIGSNSIRKKIHNILLDIGVKFVSIIDPSALISKTAYLGQGSVILSKAIVNADAKIGDGVIVNTASIVEHDCSIGNFCHISPNATICGTVNVGPETWVGAGATVVNNLSICDSVTIGAGSIVLNNINSLGTWVGVVK